MQNKVTRYAVIIGLSALVGCVNGFFGGGGGMLCVPLLEQVVKLPTKKAHATAIAVIAPVTLFSSVAYLISGAAPFPEIWFGSGGVLIGGIVGALILKKIPSAVTGVIFAVMMIAAGVKLCL